MREHKLSGKKALIYLRVSQDPSGRGLSVDSQEAECRADCERRGFEVVHVLKDAGISASRYGNKVRPEYQRALELLPSVDAFVCWEASRTVRDMAAYSEFAQLCQEHGVLWCYSGRIHDLNDPDDEFSAGMDALLAQRESGYISKRVARGIRWQIHEGRPPGQIKWGYKREYDPYTRVYKRTVEDPEIAPVIREMVRRFLAGESQGKIAADLTKRGIPTPKGRDTWTAAHIHSLLKSPSLAGKREHHGVIVGDGEWPAIINENDWLLLRERFKQGRKFAQDSNVKYLLAGVAVCGVCGSPVKHTQNRQGTGGYACKAKGCVFRKDEFLDWYVTEMVIERLSDPNLAEAFRKDDENQAGAIAAEIAALRSRLEGFYDDAADGTLSSGALVRIEERLLPQIRELETKQAAASMPSGISLDLPGPDVRQRWEALPLAGKRTAIRALVTVRIMRAAPRRGQVDPNIHEVDLEWAI